MDLVQDYGHLWCSEQYQNFFQFSWKGQFYCYCTLPQGFSDSPRMFVRVTQPLMVTLRRNMVDILIYIDDTFLRAESPERLIRNMKFTKELFQSAGLTINFKKSCLKPVQCMDFLCFTFNTVDYTISVTKEKKYNLLLLVDKILLKPTVKISIRFLAKIIGKIVSIFPACDDAKLHYCVLECFKT